MTPQEQVMAIRAAAGLRLEFRIPGQDEPFVVYPNGETMKQRVLCAA
jgi:hypothetical protein